MMRRRPRIVTPPAPSSTSAVSEDLLALAELAPALRLRPRWACRCFEAVPVTRLGEKLHLNHRSVVQCCPAECDSCAQAEPSGLDFLWVGHLRAPRLLARVQGQQGHSCFIQSLSKQIPPLFHPPAFFPLN